MEKEPRKSFELRNHARHGVEAEFELLDFRAEADAAIIFVAGRGAGVGKAMPLRFVRDVNHAGARDRAKAGHRLMVHESLSLKTRHLTRRAKAVSKRLPARAAWIFM